MMRLKIFALLGVAVVLTGSMHAATFAENFTSSPMANGWQPFGNASLFAWDSTNQNLHVTWDSAQTNSYLYRPLGTILTRADSFSASFDLTFEDYEAGVNPSKTGAAPVALGFFNLAEATRTNFFRGVGQNATYGARSLVEFNFFPPFEIFEPTIAQAVVSTNALWLYNHSNLLPMPPGQTFRVTMNYSNATLTTTVTNNGVKYGVTQIISVPTTRDFRCDVFSISCYTDANSTSSLLAHGCVDNLVLTLPPPPIQSMTGGFNGSSWRVQFVSQTNWLYTLERTTNFTAWSNVGSTQPGNNATLSLTDPLPPASQAAYRVRAEGP